MWTPAQGAEATIIGYLGLLAPYPDVVAAAGTVSIYMRGAKRTI